VTETWIVRGRRYYDTQGTWTWEPDAGVSNAERICELLDSLMLSEARIETLQRKVDSYEMELARDGQAGA